LVRLSTVSTYTIQDTKHVQGIICRRTCCKAEENLCHQGSEPCKWSCICRRVVRDVWIHSRIWTRSCPWPYPAGHILGSDFHPYCQRRGIGKRRVRDRWLGDRISLLIHDTRTDERSLPVGEMIWSRTWSLRYLFPRTAYAELFTLERMLWHLQHWFLRAPSFHAAPRCPLLRCPVKLRSLVSNVRYYSIACSMQWCDFEPVRRSRHMNSRARLCVCSGRGKSLWCPGSKSHHCTLISVRSRCSVSGHALRINGNRWETMRHQRAKIRLWISLLSRCENSFRLKSFITSNER